MNAACPTCGRAAPPAARYCRACYTILPPPKEEARRSGSGGKAWQFFCLALIGGGGWWAYQADADGVSYVSGETESRTESAEKRDRPRRTRSAPDRANRSDRERRSDRAERSDAAAPPSTTDWLLEIAPEQICSSVASCEVTIHFPSGETARFAVERRQESRSALRPAGDIGRRLLSRNSRGTLVAPAADRSPRQLPIVKLGERWVGLGALGASAVPAFLEPATQRGP